MKRKMLLIGITGCLLLFGCGSNTTEKPEFIDAVVDYTIDVNSYAALAGDADYVIIGKVVEGLGTDYKSPVMVENDFGFGKEVSTPYTNYRVEVIENLQGELSQEAPIVVVKDGGFTKDGNTCNLYEDDTLPTVGDEYVFYIYAQEDGSNLASGANSTIPLGEDLSHEITRMTIPSNDDRETILEKVKEGVANPIKSDRVRSISKDDAATA